MLAAVGDTEISTIDRSLLIAQAISAALPGLRAALPATVRIGAYANGFSGTTSEWLAKGQRAQLPQLKRDPRTSPVSHSACFWKQIRLRSVSDIRMAGGVGAATLVAEGSCLIPEF